MDDIKILNIMYDYQTIITTNNDDCILLLNGLKVEFNYKRIRNCFLYIETDKELSIEEIRIKIFGELQTDY